MQHFATKQQYQFETLLWRHNKRDSVSNHQPHDGLINRLFRRKSKQTSRLRVTGLCVGNSPGTGEFPAQMASNEEIVSIWWRHHENFPFVLKCKHDHFMLFGYWATWVKEVFQTLASSFKRSGRPRHANNTSVTCTSMCNLHVLYLLRSETTIRWQYNVTGVNSKCRESWWELFSHFKWRHLVHEMTK